MKLGFRKGEKGFTLVELMVVMAILGVLSSIVIPSITGTKQLSTDTQVKQDASSVETAVHQYSAETEGAESLETDDRDEVLAETPVAKMIISSNWPEVAIITNYAAEFPKIKGTSSDNVSGVNILDLDGTTIYNTDNATTPIAKFVTDFNAINITTLVSLGYLEENPTQYDAVFSISKGKLYHNYMWVVKKIRAGADPVAGRAVQVYKLTKIEEQTSGGPDVLTYQRLF